MISRILSVRTMASTGLMFKWGNSLPIPDQRVNKSHKRIHSEMTRVPGTNSINRASSSSILIPGFVTPQLLYNYYNISSPYGPSLVSQAVYETINDALNPDDLTNFQNFFSLPVTQSLRLLEDMSIRMPVTQLCIRAASHPTWIRNTLWR